MTARTKEILFRCGLTFGGMAIGPLSWWAGLPWWIVLPLMLVSFLAYCMSGIILMGEPLPPTVGGKCYICGAESTHAIHHSWSMPSIVNPPESIPMCEKHQHATAARGVIRVDGEFYPVRRD